MGTFAFRAIDGAGGPARGEVEADSKAAVTDQLRAKGLIVLDVSEKKEAVQIRLGGGRVKARDKVVMSRQFATLIGSGMSMLRSLYTLEDQTENEVLKDVLGQVRADVEAGSSLSAALVKHPKVFDELYCSMVASGEGSGQVEQALDRIAFQLEKADSLRRQVKSAMTYPVLVMAFAAAVVIGLVTFLVPTFVGILEDVTKDSGEDSSLPLPTQITVAASDLFTSKWWLVIGLTVAVVFGFRKWKASDQGRGQWDTVKLALPVKIGDVVQKVALARWSRTFAGLIAAGVPMLQAISITGKTGGNTQIEKAMDDVYDSVKSGGTIAGPLRNAEIFPNMVAHMVGVGEDTGALEEMLGKIADFYEDEVDSTIKSLTSIIEPVMIIFVGGAVGFIVISMYLPLFSIYDKIG